MRQSHEIATRQGIPEPYLRQILASLAKHHLIQSNRGPQGGHSLALASPDISLRDILLALEGQVTSVDQILAQPCSIDIGTERWIEPERLENLNGLELLNVQYFTFLPDYLPKFLMRPFLLMERALEAGWLRRYTVHYMATLQKVD